jgi:hypothetical protein
MAMGVMMVAGYSAGKEWWLCSFSGFTLGWIVGLISIWGYERDLDRLSDRLRDVWEAAKRDEKMRRR